MTASTAALSGSYTVVDQTLASARSLPPWNIEEHQAYADRFASLDPELGRVYGGIAEVLFATRAVPVRTALGLMRQAFDALLDKLAPTMGFPREPKMPVRVERPAHDVVFDDVVEEHVVAQGVAIHGVGVW
jgi:hypothetical protein